MKYAPLIFLSFAIFLGAAQNAQAIDYDLSAMKQSFRDLSLKAAERKNCLRYNKAGKAKGNRFYKQLFPSCTDFLLAGGSFHSFFNPASDFEDRTDACFESGYREAFVRASVEQWVPCMVEMGTALESSNADSLEACKKLGSDSKEVIDLVSLSETDPMTDERAILDSDEFARIVFFADSGFGQQVWKDLIELGQQRQTQIFSCNLAFASELFRDSL